MTTAPDIVAGLAETLARADYAITENQLVALVAWLDRLRRRWGGSMPASPAVAREQSVRDWLGAGKPGTSAAAGFSAGALYLEMTQR